MDHFTRPEFGAAALVTIDTQGDTLDGQLFEVRGTSDVLPAMGRLCRLFRAKGRPIVHIVRLYSPDGRGVSEMAGIGVALMAVSQVEDALGGC